MTMQVTLRDREARSACFSGDGVATDHGVHGVPKCTYHTSPVKIQCSTTASTFGSCRSNTSPFDSSKAGPTASPTSCKAPVVRAVPAYSSNAKRGLCLALLWLVCDSPGLELETDSDADGPAGKDALGNVVGRLDVTPDRVVLPTLPGENISPDVCDDSAPLLICRRPWFDRIGRAAGCLDAGWTCPPG